MNLRRFFDIAWERHRIYVLKETGLPKPWTTDEIFLDNYFCNVFRRIDKTTVWIVDNAITPNEDNPELWKTIIMCRYISRISTLKWMQETKCLIGNQQLAYDVLREMQAKKDKIFTNAFIVNSATSQGVKDKVTYLFSLIRDMHRYCDDAPDAAFRGLTTMQSVFDAFHEMDGVGNFMAFQYAVDFTYSQRYLLCAKDKLSWTQLGLGAVRGMNRLLGNGAVKLRIPNALELCHEILEEWNMEVCQNIEEQAYNTWSFYPEPTKEEIRKLYWPFEALTLADCEHWICEYDKYERLRTLGTGKRKYHGRA